MQLQEEAHRNHDAGMLISGEKMPKDMPQSERGRTDLEFRADDIDDIFNGKVDPPASIAAEPTDTLASAVCLVCSALASLMMFGQSHNVWPAS